MSKWTPMIAQANMHAILAPRMMLHLRSSDQEGKDRGSILELSTMQFKARFMPRQTTPASHETHA